MAGTLTPKNPVNGSYPTTLRSKTNFPIFQQHITTLRFGEISPIFAHEQVGNDDDSLNCQTRLDSLPVGSPLLSQVRLHRLFGGVPLSAIYYNTYSKIFVNPKKGDDVDFSSVRALLNFSSLMTYLQTLATSDLYSLIPALRATALVIYLLELDNVPARLRLLPYSLPIGVRTNDNSRSLYSQAVDTFLGYFIESAGDNLSITFEDGDVSYTLQYSKDPSGVHGVRQFFYDLNFLGGSITSVSGIIVDDLRRAFSETFVESQAIISLSSAFRSRDINIERLIAYQLLCAQFLTNSSIDPVFSAELYRQNMESLAFAGITNASFLWNGIRVYYDWCSAYVLRRLVSAPISAITVDTTLSFFENLLCPQRSLRYGDMINSAFSQPLAVGDVTAEVAGSAVSAVDMVESILVERFLNLVNSAPGTIQSYSAAVFGVVPDQLPPEPKLYSHSVDDLNDVVNTNTADAQGTLNSTFSLRSNRQEYYQHFNQETVTIGVCWFDSIQCYAGGITPFADKIDRMDYYLPQLQNIGMQPVKNVYGFPAVTETVFGYLPNDYEYKQELSFATGAVADNTLPYWAFVRSADNSFPNVNFFAIRHQQGEFDNFYKSMTGFGVAHFHFICSFVFNLNASRPMEFNPGILMR